MNSVLRFGKYKGKTLIETFLSDPEWFDSARENGVFDHHGGRALQEEADGLVLKTRSVKPQFRGKKAEIAFAEAFFANPANFDLPSSSEPPLPAEMDFESQISEIEVRIIKAGEAIEPFVDSLSRDLVDGSIDGIFEAVEVFKRLAALVRQHQPHARRQLHVVRKYEPNV